MGVPDTVYILIEEVFDDGTAIEEEDDCKDDDCADDDEDNDDDNEDDVDDNDADNDADDDADDDDTGVEEDDDVILLLLEELIEEAAVDLAELAIELVDTTAEALEAGRVTVAVVAWPFVALTAASKLPAPPRPAA